MKNRTAAVELLELWLYSKKKAYTYVNEFSFHETRSWRIDYLITAKSGSPILDLAVEIEGITYKGAGTRHQRGAGFELDCEKYAQVLVYGYPLLRVTPAQVTRGEAMIWIDAFFDNQGCARKVRPSRKSVLRRSLAVAR